MAMEEHRTSCPGFLDDYGVWNNGFECPPLLNQIRICCGSDSRRYCCTLASWTTTTNRNLFRSSTITSTSLSLIKRFHSTGYSIPLLLICLSILIILFVFLLILFISCYCIRRRKQKKASEEQSVGKQTLLVDHFPFSPPHHQLFFNETDPSTSLIHSKPKETSTSTTATTLAPSTLPSTSSGSSSSAFIPSDIYFHDWKEFFVNSEQPMNIYPTNSSHHVSASADNAPSYLHPLYRFQSYCQQEDIIV